MLASSQHPPPRYHFNVLSRLCTFKRVPDVTTERQSEPEATIRLAELRRRLGLSQAAVASAVGTTQSGISRIERQDDLRVSTLHQYVEAIGGQLRLMVEFEDRRFNLSFGVPASPEDESAHRAYRVIWQDGVSRALAAEAASSRPKRAATSRTRGRTAR